MRHARRKKDRAPSVEPTHEPQGQQRALFSGRLVRPLSPMNIQDQIKRYKNGELNSREGLELLDALLAEAAASYEPKGADLHVRMALSCLEELEPTAISRKRRMVRNFNEHAERESQLSAARVCLDRALDILVPRRSNTKVRQAP